MGKNKLAKFAEMERLPNVLQYPFATLQETGFDYKGLWNERIFNNNNPIVLELGCGRGEYTVGLAKAYPNKNFIGIDIKGNRMWTGAKEAHLQGLSNVRFLRTHIELLQHFFAPNEVSEIWITFPDPQMKRLRKRMTSVRFMHAYRHILQPEGIIHLKTDSHFMYTFTREMAMHNNLHIITDLSDIYTQAPESSALRTIQTYYESQWLLRGITIKYLQFSIDNITQDSSDPNIEIEYDDYRSYNRQRRSEIGL